MCEVENKSAREKSCPAGLICCSPPRCKAGNEVPRKAASKEFYGLQTFPFRNSGAQWRALCRLFLTFYSLRGMLLARHCRTYSTSLNFSAFSTALLFGTWIHAAAPKLRGSAVSFRRRMWLTVVMRPLVKQRNPTWYQKGGNCLLLSLRKRGLLSGRIYCAGLQIAQ